MVHIGAGLCRCRGEIARNVLHFTCLKLILNIKVTVSVNITITVRVIVMIMSMLMVIVTATATATSSVTVMKSRDLKMNPSHISITAGIY
jgi:hypothetical protein